MKKPSMYSERYGKAKKRARLRRNLSLTGAALILFLLFFLPYLNGKIEAFKANGNQFPGGAGVTTAAGSTQAATQPAATSSRTTPAATTAQATTAPATADQTISHDLTAGGSAQIRYAKEDGAIRYLGVAGSADSLHYDISPDGSQILLLDPAGQTLTVYGQDLEGADHSFERYDNRERGPFERKDLAGVDGFVWMGDPRFLNNDIILYESQLSLAMDAVYIWALSLADDRHRLISGTKSADAELLERIESGYKVRLDDRIVTISADLQVTE